MTGQKSESTATKVPEDLGNGETRSKRGRKRTVSQRKGERARKREAYDRAKNQKKKKEGGKKERD